MSYLKENLSLLKKNSQSKGMSEEVSLLGLYFLFFLKTQGSCEKEWKEPSAQ